MFNSLVKNAIDFFSEAVDQLEDKPKYSIINFYSAIELFLKSRLICEHWSLLVADINEANLAKFKAGNFRSVNMDEINNRLKKIVNQPINESSIEVFDRIRKHRNRLIHFFDNITSEKLSDEELAEIMLEQCQGWFHLYRLLTNQWKDYYSEYTDELNNLDIKMKENRRFLKIKYDKIKPDLDKGKERGRIFIQCPICGHDSYKQDDALGPLKEYICLVCDGSEEALTINCPECNDIILSRELGEGECDSCNFKLDIGYLIYEFGEALSPKESLDSRHAFCSECEAPNETVVPIDDEYLCLNCLSSFESINQCEYCAQNITKDATETYLYGCGLCSGRLA